VSYTSLLASVEIFDELNPERLARLARICVEQRYREGDVIFEQHAASDGLYIILAGVVEIRLPSADAPLTVARLQRGQSFGEVALVDDKLLVDAPVRKHKASDEAEKGILIVGVDKLLTQLAGCCKPAGLHQPQKRTPPHSLH